MNVKLQPGRYVVAVSGGIDSVVLLDLLRRQPLLELVVAHFDHGIRPDSSEDARFVADLAAHYGLPFVSKRRDLGPRASEAAARSARYDFLRRVQQDHGARAIVTAHHQDDVLETAILNLLRGTNRRGLTALRSTDQLKRPLLNIPKIQIKNYALKHELSWREDSTNHDERYARNYVRHRLLVRFDPGARQQLLALIASLQSINSELDGLLSDLIAGDNQLPRRLVAGLPHPASKELLANWLRSNDLGSYDRRTLERLAVQVKVGRPGKKLDILANRQLLIGREKLVLI